MATTESKSVKVRKIFRQFNGGRDGGLNIEEMAALVVAVNRDFSNSSTTISINVNRDFEGLALDLNSDDKPYISVESKAVVVVAHRRQPYKGTEELEKRWLGRVVESQDRP